MTRNPLRPLDPIRAAVRRGAEWVVWSPRRTIATVGAVLGALSLAFVITTTTTVVDTASAVRGMQPGTSTTSAPTAVPPGMPQSQRKAWPGDPTATPTETPTATTKLAGGAEDTTRAFTELWLAGAGKQRSEHAAWAEKMTPYVNPAMRAHLDSTEMSVIPEGTISTVSTSRIGDLVTTTVTLNTGRTLIVQAMWVDDQWQVSAIRVMAL